MYGLCSELKVTWRNLQVITLIMLYDYLSKCVRYIKFSQPNTATTYVYGERGPVCTFETSCCPSTIHSTARLWDDESTHPPWDTPRQKKF